MRGPASDSELGPSIALASFTHETRNATLAQLLAFKGWQGAVAKKNPEGKPFLLMPNGSRKGLAITHLRKIAQPFSLMAIADAAMFGIDAEAWPIATTDAAFLNTISSAEDSAVITKLKSLNHDTGIALWTMKEAALKASGEVQNEPQNLCIKITSGGYCLAATSAAAAAPVTAARVGLWRFSKRGANQSGFLAVAFATIPSNQSAALTKFNPSDQEFAFHNVI